MSNGFGNKTFMGNKRLINRNKKFIKRNERKVIRLKTIKIIDLLNMIANGEEELKFWWSGCIHELKKDSNNVYSIYDTYCKKYKTIGVNDLNDEVEIIEDKEDKKIADIRTFYDKNLEEYIAETRANDILYKECFNSLYDKMIIDKLNEIIDFINKNEEEK